MSTSPTNPSARKHLPAHPSRENLRKQAKRRAKLESLQLAQAQHLIASDYGCRNWAELMQLVDAMNRNANVPLMSSEGKPNRPLHAAARAKDLDAVTRLLSAGQYTQEELDSALAAALWYGDARSLWPQMKTIADLLLQYGADVNGFITTYGPIVFGTGECLQPDSLQYLIDNGADVTFAPIPTKYGPQSPLSYWLGTYDRGQNENKHRGVQILLEHRAHIPEHITPELLALHQGDFQTLAKILDQNPSLLTHRYPNMPYGNIPLAGATLLHAAVEFGEIEIIDLLLNRHADINAPALITQNLGGQPPIFHAIASINNALLPTLEHLINRAGKYIDMSIRASFTLSDKTVIPPVTPLEYAELAAQPQTPHWRRSSEKELTLLQFLDRRGQIKNAILKKDPALVTKLLDQHPELLTPELWPPAIFQARSFEITRLLLSRGLSPDLCSAPRKPLHLAVYQCLADIVELLLQNHADANQLNPLNERPLDLLDAYEPRPLNDPASARIRRALLQAGAKEDIHTAIRAGDVAAVRQFLDADPALLHSQTPWPPLFTAARSARLEVAKLLLDRGAAVDQQNGKLNTPLWFACHSPANSADRQALIELLLQNHANPNARCEDQTTPLHFAARRGPSQIVAQLLAANADPTLKDSYNRIPLDHAKESTTNPDQQATIALLQSQMTREQLPLIPSPADAFLLAATPDPTRNHRAGTTAQAEKILAENPDLPRDNFHVACALGDFNAIVARLTKTPTLATTPGGPRGWLPLLYLTFSKFLRLASPSAMNFHNSAVVLLSRGADPNSFWTMPNNPGEKETALYGAAGIANNGPLTKLLLDAGADPHDHESLYHAAEFQDNAALKVLLPAITDARSLSYCMCHKMDMEDAAGLELFLDHHADPNALILGGQRQGDRPLHFALHRHRSAAIIQMLLERGADPNLADAQGQSPYQLALRLGQLEAAELLLKHGAKDDGSPKLRLLAALSTGNAELAHELVRNHPGLVGELTVEDHTLLVDAAQSGNARAAALMLSAPFNFPVEIRKPKAAAWDGTPLHHAAYFAWPDVVKLLLEHGADPHLVHGYGGNGLTTTLHAACHSQNPAVDLPRHLQTLSLLGGYFSREEIEKALERLPGDAPAEIGRRLRSLIMA